MENQAEYGEQKVCPIMSCQGWVSSTCFKSHSAPCLGERCGMYNLCQAKPRGIDVKITPPTVGL